MFQDTGLIRGKRERTKLPGVGRRITEFLGTSHSGHGVCGEDLLTAGDLRYLIMPRKVSIS